MRTIWAVLRNAWQTGNRSVRKLVLWYLVVVILQAISFSAISGLGYGKVIPYLTLGVGIWFVLWLAGWARITRGRHGPARYTAGEPILLIAIDRVLKARLLLFGVPMATSIYTWLVPMSGKPGWIAGVILSVSAMIIFSGSLATDWPWAKVMRKVSMFVFFGITAVFFWNHYTEKYDVEGRGKVVDAVIAWKTGDSKVRLEAARKADEMVKRAIRNRERDDIVAWATPAAATIAAGRPIPPKPTPVPIGTPVPVMAPASAEPEFLENQDGRFELMQVRDKVGWYHFILINNSAENCHILWKNGANQGTWWDEGPRNKRERAELFPIKWDELSKEWHANSGRRGFMRIYPK